MEWIGTAKLFVAFGAFVMAIVALSLLEEEMPSRLRGLFAEMPRRRAHLFMIIVACLGVGDAASCSIGSDRGYESAMYHLASVPVRAAIIELARYRRDLSQHTTDSPASTP